MSENPFSLWVYLSQSPLLWLTVTLLTYAVADAVSLKTHRHPLANPVLHSMWIIGAFLLVTGTSYTTYFGGAQFVHFLLGPATVALAVPLYENRKVVAAAILPMLVALLVGSVTASRWCCWQKPSACRAGSSCRWRRNRSPRESRWASANPCMRIRR
jgi:putative effector of murein hydrolase